MVPCMYDPNFIKIRPVVFTLELATDTQTDTHTQTDILPSLSHSCSQFVLGTQKNGVMDPVKSDLAKSDIRNDRNNNEVYVVQL